MKKIFKIILFTVVAVLTLCGCEKASGKVDYDSLTKKLNSDYSGWTLTVMTKKDDVTLTDIFTVKNSDTQTEIEYSIEKLSEHSFDDDNDFITKKSGTAVIKDGKIETVNGDEVTIEIENIATLGLSFKAEYFGNAKFSDTSFSASVTNPSGFLGKSLTCTDMTVYASFADKFTKINITYTAENGAKIVCTYSFEG